MHLQNIKVDNLGPFKGLNLEFHKGYNALVGPNGCGKSILLQIPSRLMMAARDSAPLLLNPLKPYLLGDGIVGLTADLAPAVGQTTFSANFALNGSIKPSLHQNITTNLKKILGFLFPEINHPTFVYIGPERGRVTQQMQSQIDTNTWREQETSVRFSKLHHLFSAFRDHPGSFESEIQQLYDKFFNNGSAPIAKYNRSRTVLNTQNLATDVSMSGVCHEILSSASGCLEILFIVAETGKLNNSVIIIDEPELHLHPQAQQMMGKYLYHLTTPDGGNNQVILGTHSLHMMYGFPKGKIIHLLRNGSTVTPETIIEDGAPTAHYDNALNDLGFHRHGYNEAFKFLHTYRKQHPSYSKFTVPDDSARGTRP